MNGPQIITHVMGSAPSGAVCRLCINAGKDSVLTQGVTESTLAGYFPQIVNGIPHNHDRNRHATAYTCANGHIVHEYDTTESFEIVTYASAEALRANEPELIERFDPRVRCQCGWPVTALKL